MPSCPYGCGVNHRVAPTKTNCVRYPSSLSTSTTNVAASALTSRRSHADRRSNGVATDRNGNPLTLFHGTATDFESFDSEFTGNGNDTYGSGFYFTDDEDSAKGYGSHVKQVQLVIKKPFRMTGDQAHINKQVHFSAAESSAILAHHPDIYAQPNDEERFNPIGDYLPEFWDRETWSKSELDTMRRKMCDEMLDGAEWSSVESVFGKGAATESFRRGVQQATGKDGVVVDFEDGSRTWVAWFPEQIKTL